jgi:NADH-quinone oxidoreductase subunit J
MSGQEIAFGVLAVLGGVAALAVVTARNVVHSALFLVVALASIAGVYLVLAAPFVAFVQVIIYVGAVVVLLLFGIMLTRASIGRRVLDNAPSARLGAAIVGASVFAMLSIFLIRAFGGERIEATPTSLDQLGTSIFQNFVLPFEAVSVLLLAALIGAIVLSRRD